MANKRIKQCTADSKGSADCNPAENELITTRYLSTWLLLNVFYFGIAVVAWLYYFYIFIEQQAFAHCIRH